MSVLKSLCRLCLGSISDLNRASVVCQNEKPNEQNMIFICTALELKIDVDLPNKICVECNAQLQKILHFREQCINTENLLLKFLQCSNKSEIMGVKFPVGDSLNNYDALAKLISSPSCIDSRNNECNKYNTIESWTDESLPQNSLNKGESSVYNSIKENESDSESFCDSFDNEISESSHTKRKRLKKKTPNGSYVCKYCHKSYPSQGGWRYHVYTVHNQCYQPFICDLCGKAFKVKKNLDGHKNAVHFGIKQNLCDLCGKGFATKYALSVHKTWHSGEKNFPCEVCGLRFNTLSKVNTHRSIHGAPKKFMCEVCSRKYRWKKDFEIHIRSHTGEKPYHCRICNKAFSSQTNSKKHEKTRHQNVPAKVVTKVTTSPFPNQFDNDAIPPTQFAQGYS